MADAEGRARIGVDIGGAFTDVAAEIEGHLFSTKVLTTHKWPEIAILERIGQICALGGIGRSAKRGRTSVMRRNGEGSVAAAFRTFSG